MSERKISDEIREWCKDLDSEDVICTTFDLYALADRIDREMFELPKDMDGAPIHVGDMVYLDDGRIAIVDAVEFIQEFGGRIKCFNSKYGYANRSPEEVAHESHDSFERIADELDEMVDAADHPNDTYEKIADLAERIRKLAAKEDK